MRRITAILVLALCATACAAEEPTFLGRHCLECHDAATAKGGLSLEGFSPEAIAPEQTDVWTRVHDRVAKGEMPPAKKAKPAREDVAAFLANLTPRLTDADRKRREVVQRRLNREEYQNTIRDLLAVDADVKSLLPGDQQAGGFDNNGEALAISTEQMQCYLEAARVAVDAALLVGERPKLQTWTVDPADELKKAIEEGAFQSVDGRVVLAQTDRGDYSKVATRAKRTPARGRYRVKFTAAAVNTAELQFFTVSASNFAAIGPVSKNLGYFEVGPEPRTFVIDETIDARCAVQFFAFGLPGWFKPDKSAKHPGIGFGPVEFTGPIVERWPPESYSRLLGEASLDRGTIADAERVLRGFMPRAFRRAVTDDEVGRYVGLVKGRMDLGRGFSESLRAGLVAVLCSPNFLYLREDVRPGAGRVSDAELASRLSYFLWSTMPDRELMDLAAAGKLHEPEALGAQVERMLKDPRSEGLVRDFCGQWLRLRQINDTTPDERLFGARYDELLRVSMVRESEGFFRQMLVEDLPVSDFLDSDWAMLNERLAKLYGVPGVSGIEVRKVKLPAGSVRGGVLTQGAVLKVTANGTTTSPVIRGVWVLENILGEPTPPPPPNAGAIEPDIRGATTVREQLDKHRRDASCSVCHQRIDPPGFALESFDPIGDWRENYLRWNVTNAEKGWGNVAKGARVDCSGNLASGEAFADVRAFKKLLAARRGDFERCLTEKLLTYALGREMGFSDRPSVAEIVKRCEARGGGLRGLILEVVASEAFARQ